MGGNTAPCRLFFRVLILARPCNPPAGVETRSAKQDLFRHSQAREDRVKATSLVLCAFLCVPAMLLGQGVTTAAMSGTVSGQDGAPLTEANVVAVHVSSGTAYRAVARAGGAYNIPNMRVGGPYRVTASRIGYKAHTEENLFLSLGQDLKVDFRLQGQAIQLMAVVAAAHRVAMLKPG